MTKGYIPDVIQPEHYIFGSGEIQADILQPDGQWDDYLPSVELQNLNGVETYACATFGTDNAIETLARRKFGVADNFSDRFIAKQSGTEYQHGNSPHTVAEYIRSTGTVNEPVWPFSQDIRTFSDFYAAVPPNVQGQAVDFLNTFDFRHDWVPTDTATLKNALQYSPLGVSVYAWQQEGDMYVRPAGAADDHWTMLYGYVDGQYWKIFDSYDNTQKKLAWNFGFGQAKRYHLTPSTRQQQLSLWTQILQLIARMLAPQSQNPAPVALPQPIPVVPPPVVVPAPTVPVQKYLWDTPDNCRNSIRLICDEEGLTPDLKDSMSRTIHCESGYNAKHVHPNYLTDKVTGKLVLDEHGQKQLTSTDYGICEINDYWHIGPHKDFPSVDYVLNNPEMCVRWMCKLWKTGEQQRRLWLCYSFNMIKSYTP